MKVQIKVRKTNGSAELLSFRVREGRKAEITYATSERIDVSELKRCYICAESDKYITSDLQKVKGVRRPNEELKDSLDNYVTLINEVWNEIKGNAALMNGAAFKERMTKKINGDDDKVSDLIEERYKAYIESQFESGLLSKGRYAHYQVSLRELRRFLAINKMLSLTVSEFDGNTLLRLRTFLENEFKHVAKHRGLYAGMDERQIPTAPRSQNTIASKLKFYRTFFNYLYESGEIARSPFQAVGQNNRKVMMAERYDAPVFLTVEELAKIRNAEIPENLEEVRDCFMLSCQIGARIEDFRALSMDNIKIDNEGFAYVEYMPSKTLKEGMVVQTPLMESGLRTIVKYGFRFRCLENLWGCRGYNYRIKELARLAKIEREITTTVGGMETKKLCEMISTKVARKTFVTAMQQTQIDDYAAGLHADNSEAVHRYGDASKILKNRFVLMCAAFGEKPYKTDSNLQIM